MRMEISLSRKMAFGFALALLILVVMGVVSYRSTIRFAESASEVARSHRIHHLLQAVLADVVSAESEARGYVITENEIHLALYRTAIRDVERDLNELRRTVLSPDIQQRVAVLDQLVQKRLDRLRVTVETRRLEGLDAVREAAGVGKKLMDELRAVVADIEKLENALLAERDENAKALASRTITVVIVGSLFAVLLAAVSTVVLTTDIAHRERLEKEVLEISEREQRRIGQDLHDGLCQELTGISLLSRSLHQKLADRSSDEAAEAARITHLINTSIEQTRRVTRGLHPVSDEPTGLMVALQELVDHVRNVGKLACQFDCPQPVPIPSRAAATHLYRIAQEAVQNALRHAKATTITISLKSDEKTITLTVHDDGCGLPDHRPKTGMGLEIMNYRAHTIGARIETRRAKDRGTVVRCTLPRNAVGLGETE
ncbi:MAG: CHASE3 domain-containing protein [Verrucomicrobiae bacterium]|nr:CHASE3 domain-containing protein [Verrucomicrobiae bacterium]